MSNIPCKVCGESFEPKKRSQRICSNTCKGLFRRKRVILSCRVCKKVFETKKYMTKRGCETYCSKQCSFKGRHRKVASNCKTCGEPFVAHPSRNRVFCSKVCFYLSIRDEGHYLWKGSPYDGEMSGKSYNNIHKWVRRNYGSANHCERCGLNKLPKEKKRFFDWANISGEYKRIESDWKQLCKLCHKAFDGARHT